MNFNTSAVFDQQEGLVVLVGKKIEPQTKLPKVIAEELESFHKDADSQFLYLPIKGKHYVFIKDQATDEKQRIMGNKLRGALPKTVKSIFIDGGKSNSLLLAEGFALSNYQYLRYRKEATKEKFALESIDFSTKITPAVIAELTATVKAVFWARDLVNEPVSGLNATQLAESIEEKGKEAKFSVTILEKSKIEALKMGGLLSVNKGSIDPPTFTIIEYKPKKASNKKPIVLVGKGVVYDTGGLSLKPTAGSMDSMKSDMAGAAMMAGTIYAAAMMELPIHLIGLIPATDNRPGLNAYAPGDIITMYDGTTVEVLNTDAEGRMILADALAYSEKFKPELVIDAATLTGAAVRAIGSKASIIMGNADKKYFNLLNEAGMETYERVVEFPFWDDYYDEMKSKIADLNNIGSGYAGMITAGKFLEHFVKSPYIHMDIAGPAFLDKPQDYRGFGGTGTGIRLLISFLKKLA
ncbi:leucyl aminopeptidase family protein [Fluviicola taffensis]|uniref:Peptidase M17 leucyl aminopeptidase domain protein n=1 Tax=Fluviicola taffensis (strain DSM 16823 / NCIMB 13979 / RW262) TaxID=755732 RepID=F2IC15_FLUTR|nr:leucyl aminopeptidase family protein [Fluviicola taffensis]AEA43241.1 peptidase M17 leucyl aminopeptidase domain protein [Fluviicola taffensis DSM 16823]